jgi:hypothetical protein
MRLDLLLALATAAALGGFAIYASWRASLPADPLKPRLLPWRALMIGATTGVVLALAAAASFLGAPDY